MTNTEPLQPSRKERERLLRRQSIIDAALRVFAYKGFSDAKLEDVAELAEFGKATLYSYFPTKEALFKSVLEDSFTRMKRMADEAFAADATFEERLARFIRNELEYFYNHPESLHLMMSEAHHLRGANPMLKLMPTLIDTLTKAIEGEQKKKRMLARIDPIDLALMLLNMLFSQSLSRVYRFMQEEGVDVVMKDEKSVQEFLERLKRMNPEKEIERATSLIVTVYMRGAAQ